MADIFISYSKTDTGKARLLDSHFESQGYTVWWDKHLEVSDAFTHEIQKQLAITRAVIVIWSENSIKSRYVNAEALYAYNNLILLPVRSNDLESNAIPTPFNAIQTALLDDQDAILDGVRKQLIKPPPKSPLTKTLRHEVLLWFGSINGTIMIFTNLEGILTLASWARLIAEKWHATFAYFFGMAFDIMDIDFDPNLTGLLTLCLFVITTAAGVRISSKIQPSILPYAFHRAAVFAIFILTYYMLDMYLPDLLFFCAVDAGLFSLFHSFYFTYDNGSIRMDLGVGTFFLCFFVLLTTIFLGGSKYAKWITS